jgi:RTX calcium-binding nonapeptide repeat (4 copies)
VSSGAGSLRRAGVGAVVIATAAIAAPSFGAQREAQPVTCAMHPAAHHLGVHAHELRSRFRFPPRLLEGLSPRDRHQLHRLEREIHRTPAEIAIERRIDEITVLDKTTSPFDIDPYSSEEHGGALRNCGSPPTVDAVDSVAIDLGRHAQSANLHLDLRYGMLAPGATDEGDGGSEIELEAGLGDGYAEVQMTRGDDSVIGRRVGTARQPGRTRLNLNAAEASPDADLALGHKSPVLIHAGGGDDLLTSTGGPDDPDLEVPLALEGGEGDDTLIGGDGTDSLIDGPGNDRFKAGPGSDGIISVGHGRDHVDCGPGFDLALVSSTAGVRHCEQVLRPEDVHGFDIDRIEPGKRLPRAAQRVLSRLTLSR